MWYRMMMHFVFDVGYVLQFAPWILFQGLVLGDVTAMESQDIVLGHLHTTALS